MTTDMRCISSCKFKREVSLQPQHAWHSNIMSRSNKEYNNSLQCTRIPLFFNEKRERWVLDCNGKSGCTTIKPYMSLPADIWYLKKHMNQYNLTAPIHCNDHTVHMSGHRNQPGIGHNAMQSICSFVQPLSATLRTKQYGQITGRIKAFITHSNAAK